MPLLELATLTRWFLERKRNFPWRENPTPYAVWISEVMLQQTRADVVVPYFLNWMKRYPNVESLAESSLDEVIKQWEGLGYYSRARNLHSGAKQILAAFNGQLPQTAEELLTIKGLGPYTVNAILSFAFHQKALPLDGNVTRVLARYFAIGDDISKPLTIKKLKELGGNFLPNEEPWVISEALIELGATVCNKKPTCHSCPLKTNCLGKVNPLQYPVKIKKTVITHLVRAVGVLLHKERVLLKKENKGIMADLYEFPYFEIEKTLSPKEFKEKIEALFPIKVIDSKPLDQQNQSFTRYRADLHPFLCNVISEESISGYQWVSLTELKDIAFSSGHRRILTSFLQDG